MFALRMDMQAAASDATKELQTKDKRIHHLEKKVRQGSTRGMRRFLPICVLEHSLICHYRCNNYGMNEQPKPASSLKPSNISDA